MTHKIISFAILLMALGLFGCASGGYTRIAKDHSMQRDTLRRMSQQDVINMSKAGVSDSLIIVMMDATNTWFHLKSQDVIDLKNAGVSEKVIAAMMQPPSPPSNQSGNSNTVMYYAYPPYYWYDGYYPYWYYPGVSVRAGIRGGFHH
ncbi:MAG: hypothetical protein WAV76_03545 [Bacteroidota bacterium]